eukprot:gene8017-1247_t
MSDNTKNKYVWPPAGRPKYESSGSDRDWLTARMSTERLGPVTPPPRDPSLCSYVPQRHVSPLRPQLSGGAAKPRKSVNTFGAKNTPTKWVAPSPPIPAMGMCQECSCSGGSGAWVNKYVGGPSQNTKNRSVLLSLTGDQSTMNRSVLLSLTGDQSTMNRAPSQSEPLLHPILGLSPWVTSPSAEDLTPPCGMFCQSNTHTKVYMPPSKSVPMLSRSVKVALLCNFGFVEVNER